MYCITIAENIILFFIIIIYLYSVLSQENNSYTVVVFSSVLIDEFVKYGHMQKTIYLFFLSLFSLSSNSRNYRNQNKNLKMVVSVQVKLFLISYSPGSSQLFIMLTKISKLLSQQKCFVFHLVYVSHLFTSLPSIVNFVFLNFDISSLY